MFPFSCELYSLYNLCRLMLVATKGNTSRNRFLLSKPGPNTDSGPGDGLNKSSNIVLSLVSCPALARFLTKHPSQYLYSELEPRYRQELSLASMLEAAVAASVFSSSLSARPEEDWLSLARGQLARLDDTGSLMLVTADLAGTS